MDSTVMTNQRLIKNHVRCLHCGDHLESRSHHDYRTCRCRKVAVDGGLEYLRRKGEPGKDYQELSDYAPDEASAYLAARLRLPHGGRPVVEAQTAKPLTADACKTLLVEGRGLRAEIEATYCYPFSSASEVENMSRPDPRRWAEDSTVVKPPELHEQLYTAERKVTDLERREKAYLHALRLAGPALELMVQHLEICDYQRKECAVGEGLLNSIATVGALRAVESALAEQARAALSSQPRKSET